MVSKSLPEPTDAQKRAIKYLRAEYKAHRVGVIRRGQPRGYILVYIEHEGGKNCLQYDPSGTLTDQWTEARLGRDMGGQKRQPGSALLQEDE